MAQLSYIFIITNENPFSLTCEKVGASVGTVNSFAKNDFKQFKALFDYDFKPMEEELGIDCFTKIKIIRQLGNLNLCTIRMLVKRLEI